MINPRQVDGRDTEDLQAVLELLRREFAYMEDLIDPPSSVHRLTIENLSSGPGELWVIGTPPIACIVMTPQPNALYVGKLAVASTERGKGLARLLVDQADARARALGLAWLELQTRIELKSNQKTFAMMGFSETERTSHPSYAKLTSITYRRAVKRES